jgi:hypothetical protein
VFFLQLVVFFLQLVCSYLRGSRVLVLADLRQRGIVTKVRSLGSEAVLAYSEFVNHSHV